MGKTIVPSQITNHTIDIVNLARNFNNIQFKYCNRNANRLADAIDKKTHCTINGLYHCYIE